MKAFRRDDPSNEPAFFQKYPSIAKKAPLFLSSTIVNDKNQASKYLKKNYYSFDLDFNNNKKFPGLAAKILKRGSKYAKSLNSVLLGHQPLLNTVKGLKKLQKMELSLDYEASYLNNKLILFKNQSFKTVLNHRLKRVLRDQTELYQLDASFYVLDHILKYRRNGFHKLESLKVRTNILTSFQLPLQGIITQDHDLNSAIPKLQVFRHLIDVKFDFLVEAHDTNFLFDVFEKLSDLQNLKNLAIYLKVSHVSKRSLRTKTFMKKFANLNVFSLGLDICPNIDCGQIFSHLLPMVNLKRLVIKIMSGIPPSCSGLATLISSLKNLNSLKLELNALLFDQYSVLFNAIRKLKDLRKLSVKQRTHIENDFAYGLVYKTIKTLPALHSVNIDLGAYGQDPKEMLELPKCLLDHPSLEKAKVCMKAMKRYHAQYEFPLEFYEDMNKLVNKLNTFKVSIRDIPQEVVKKITKIIACSGKDPIYHTCSNWNFDEI